MIIPHPDPHMCRTDRRTEVPTVTTKNKTKKNIPLVLEKCNLKLMPVYNPILA